MIPVESIQRFQWEAIQVLALAGIGGVSIWVANSGSDNVTKLRASDGAVLGTFTTGTGTQPWGVAFDGANIWVTDQLSNTISKM